MFNGLQANFHLFFVSHSGYEIREALEQGWGTFLLSRTAWNVHYHWRAAKSINNYTFV